MDAGLSLNSIGKKEEKSLGSVRYWMKVYGFEPNFKNFKEDPVYKSNIVDGKKCCGKCKQWKTLEEYNSKGKYQQGYCRPCLYAYQAERWRERKKKAVMLMGGKCSKCGYCKNYSALEFHHVDPSQKDFDFNTGRRRSWDKLLVELKKCILLCSNCHKEEHHPDTILEGDAPQANVILNIGPKPTGKCLSCNTDVFGTKYCSQTCFKNSRRKAKRPTREELEELIKTTPFLQIGKMYGVSDNAIRKWADHYGIQWKKEPK